MLEWVNAGDELVHTTPLASQYTAGYTDLWLPLVVNELSFLSRINSLVPSG
jgi:hypothetical protein